MLRAIIPAAGYGTRMGMRPDQSKEMLPDPERPNQPIIQWCLDRCSNIGAEPLVIVRKEKLDLIQYLMDREVPFIVVAPGKEWADTVLYTERYWVEANLLVLPDVRWDRWNSNVLGRLVAPLLLGHATVTLATHSVDNVSLWGHVEVIEEGVKVTEKPHSTEAGEAWGIIGFLKHEGRALFDAMSRREPYISDKVSCVYIPHFKDITRGPVE